MNCLHKWFLAQTQVLAKNTGFRVNTVCELFPHIHTEVFHCVHQGHAIFTMNSRAVCQPNAMRIRSDIVANSHRVLCVKALRSKTYSATLVGAIDIGSLLQRTLLKSYPNRRATIDKLSFRRTIYTTAVTLSHASFSKEVIIACQQVSVPRYVSDEENTYQ